jgi:hypothetical protein
LSHVIGYIRPDLRYLRLKWVYAIVVVVVIVIDTVVVRVAVDAHQGCESLGRLVLDLRREGRTKRGREYGRERRELRERIREGRREGEKEGKKGRKKKYGE